MNSNIPKIMKILLIFHLCASFAHTAENASSNNTDERRYCDRKVQQALGMKGLRSPEKSKLDMCPTIDYTCCAVEDQLKIYEFWVKGNEEDNLEKRLNFHRDIYAELLNKSIDVYKRAKTVMELLQDRSVSNCKVLARRIINFRIDAVAPLLKTSIDHYHAFLKDTYKGFYCSVCDADNTRFVNIRKSSFSYNEEFCREIVYNSLHVLLYLHAHFTKYLNLLSKFVTSCDYRGVYKRATISGKYLFTTKGDHHRMLGSCHQYRNDVNWFDFCEPVCRQFSLTSFKDFFKPNTDKMRKYARWMGRELVKFKAAEAADELLKTDLERARKNAKKRRQVDDALDGFDNNTNNSRVLESGGKDCNKNDQQNEKTKSEQSAESDGEVDDEETKKLKDQQLAEEQQKFEDQLADSMMIKEKADVFESVKQASIDFSDFKNIYALEGLNAYAYGKTSMINDNTYNSIKATVDLQNKKQIGHMLNKQKKQIKKLFKSNNISSEDDDDENGVGSYTVVCVLLIVGLLMK